MPAGKRFAAVEQAPAALLRQCGKAYRGEGERAPDDQRAQNPDAKLVRPARAPANGPFTSRSPRLACAEDEQDAKEGAQPDRRLLSNDVHHVRGTRRSVVRIGGPFNKGKSHVLIAAIRQGLWLIAFPLSTRQPWAGSAGVLFGASRRRGDRSRSRAFHHAGDDQARHERQRRDQVDGGAESDEVSDKA
jgi:hypothetical protein